MNMGPTGVRVWVRDYQFQVMTVDAGSPADGVLLRGDIIVAADGIEFGEKADPRMTLGNAIGAAEADDGILTLKIIRDGKRKTVEIPLPVTGPFSRTWPYNCMKSRRILYEACDYLVKAQMPDGEIVTDGSAGLFPAGLLLLASGDVRYMDAARRAVYAAEGKDFDKIDYHNWAKGYGGVLLAEYYLATGDPSVLEKLKILTDGLAKGQMRCGSWGHNGPSGGYGAMNQAGVVCAMAMVLAQECGIDVDQVALNKALNFFGRYAELGAVPYGDHGPGTRNPDDNGKSASSSVLFSLLPDRKSEVAAFSDSIAMSYASRETGHTGGYFSMFWGPLGCAPAGQDALARFMGYQAWYYNLSRTWKGALVLLPYKEALTRFDGSSYNESGGEFTTGGLGLAFALPFKRLRILGAPRSVFGAELKGELLEARELYQKRDWTAFDKAIAALPGKGASSEVKQFAQQLKSSADLMRASKARTIKEIKNNLAEGDAYRASMQLEDLKRFFGAEDRDLVNLAGRFEDSTTQWYVREGKMYYEAWQNVRGAAVKSWVPYYGERSKLLAWEVRDLAPRLWDELVDASDEVTNEWRIIHLDPTEDLPGDWASPAFDDSSWIQCAGMTGAPVDSEKQLGAGGRILGRLSFVADQVSFRALRIKLRSARNAITDVYLNGEQVAHVVRGQRSGYAKIELDVSARDLIHKGANCLAVTSTEAGRGGNALDAGLQAVIVEQPWEGPLQSGSKAEGPQDGTAVLAPLLSLPERQRLARTETLRVDEALAAYNLDLNAQYDAMTTEMLIGEIASNVPYRRYLAVSAILRRPENEALSVAVNALQSDNWRVRSSGCSILPAVWSKHEDKGDDSAASIKKQIPALIQLLTDEHFWVRACAANALSAFGKEAESATDALVKAAADPEEWVRGAALRALEKVTDDPAPSLTAAAAAVKSGWTSFSVANTALGFVNRFEAGGEESVSLLIQMIAKPGEGMGAEMLSKAIERLAVLDPEKAVPVLARVAEGGYEYNRLRGNPRGVSIDLLCGMGARAKAALPTLKKIAASDDEADSKVREQAAKAVEAIESK